MINVSLDFTWRLESGAIVTVDAEGTYYRDGEIFPVLLGFTTKIVNESAACEILKECWKEFGKIVEHAIILLREKGRTELAESVKEASCDTKNYS